MIKRFMALLLLLLLPLVMASDSREVPGFGGLATEGFVSGAGYASDAAPEVITKMVFTMDSTMDHFLDAYDEDVANAHEILQLGAGYDVPEFAWVGIDSVTAPTSSVWIDNANRHSYDHWKTTTGNSFNITDTDYTRLGLLYIDWSEYIPAGATIISAQVHVQTAGSWYPAYADTICSTLMTNTSDSAWHTSRGVTLSSDAAPNMAHSNWSHQIAPLNINGYPATGAAWDPPLADRTAFEEWGDASDWTGFSGTVLVDTESVYSITNCVQEAVNGETNNGILSYYKRNSPQASDAFFIMEPRPAHSSWEKVPWITVTYSTKSYETPYPGGEFVFIFTTDDGVKAPNIEYASVFKEFGWNYTAYFCKSFMSASGLAGTARSMLDLWDDGNEVGSHSVKHLLPDGITTWDADGMTGAEWDSLIRDTRPEWMYTLADSVDGYKYSDMEAAPYFGKSFALPTNKVDQEGIFALAHHGYSSFRTGQETYDSYVKLSFHRPAVSDSARITGYPGDMLREQNMLGLPLTLTIGEIAGIKADTSITEDEVKWNMRRLCRAKLAQNINVVSLFTHDLKTGLIYTDGLDAEELRWMLEVVQEMGGVCMTATEYADWRKRYSTAVATPAAFAQIDSFKFDAADAVWFKPIAGTRLYPYEEE